LKARWTAVALTCGLAAACGSVPDIIFDVGADGGPDATDDGSLADGGRDADGTGDGNVAPDALTPPCPCKAAGTGVCNQAACTTCGTCLGADICCARNANAMCKPPTTCN
jgi:hypothetical protein